MWSKNVLFVTAHNRFEGAVCPTTNTYSLLLFRSRHKQWRNTKWVTNPTLHLDGDPGWRSEGAARGKVQGIVKHLDPTERQEASGSQSELQNS